MSKNYEESANVPKGPGENFPTLNPISRKDCIRNCFSSAVIGTVGYLSYRYSHIPLTEASEAVSGISPGIEDGASLGESLKAQTEMVAQLGLLTTGLCAQIGGGLAALGGAINVGVWGFMSRLVEDESGS